MISLCKKKKEWTIDVVERECITKTTEKKDGKYIISSKNFEIVTPTNKITIKISSPDNECILIPLSINHQPMTAKYGKELTRQNKKTPTNSTNEETPRTHAARSTTFESTTNMTQTQEPETQSPPLFAIRPTQPTQTVRNTSKIVSNSTYAQHFFCDISTTNRFIVYLESISYSKTCVTSIKERIWIYMLLKSPTYRIFECIFDSIKYMEIVNQENIPHHIYLTWLCTPHRDIQEFIREEMCNTLDTKSFSISLFKNISSLGMLFAKMIFLRV